MTTSAEAFVAEQTKEPNWGLMLVQGTISVIVGILLLTQPGATTTVLVQLLGIWWIVSGVLSIVGIFFDGSQWVWKLLIGVIGILAGFMVINHPLFSAIIVPSVIVTFMAIMGIIFGVLLIIQAITGGGWGAAIWGVVSAILGILLLFNPFASALALPVVAGIWLLIGGVVTIIRGIQARG